MAYAAPKRGTLLIPSGPAHDLHRKHLFVICTDTGPDGQQVLVSVSTWLNDLCDPTCRLAAHEHPFLTVASYVFYRRARIEPTAALVRGVAEGVLAPREDMNGQTFLRIVRGLCQSPQTPRLVKAYLGCVAGGQAGPSENLP